MQPTKLGLSEFQPSFGRIARRDAEPEPKKNLLGISEDAADILLTVSDALRGFPEARQAVVAALKARDERRSEDSEP